MFHIVIILWCIITAILLLRSNDRVTGCMGKRIWFIHSFQPYILEVHYMPSIVLGVRDRAVSDVVCPSMSA